MDYIYSKIDLLKKPQTYQRSPYVGLDFLQSYRSNRLDIIRSLDNTGFSIEYFFKTLKTSFEFNQKFLLSDFLYYVMICSQDKSRSIMVKKNTDLLLKKFEVKKKLFVQYDQNFKEDLPDYSDLTNYVLFALLCLIEYESTMSLKYLNSCLKLTDIVSSQIAKYKNDNGILRYVLEKELEFVEKLCNKKGILL